ncbi:MAG: hypothetical protein KBT33_07735 [Prevotellaceae bacterium]|nr:hypothetical protein [Candidatus Minthosoma equi]
MGTLIRKACIYNLLLFALLSSCRLENYQEEIYPNIEFVYEEKGVQTFNAIRDPEILLSDPFRADTIVTDSSIVKCFINSINKLENYSENQSIDIRVVSIIHFSDSTKKTICFGENWGTMVDGKYKCDDPNLFLFINNLLYDEKGWKKLIIRSYKIQGRDSDITLPVFQDDLKEIIHRLRKDGYVYPKNDNED